MRENEKVEEKICPLIIRYTAQNMPNRSYIKVEAHKCLKEQCALYVKLIHFKTYYEFEGCGLITEKPWHKPKEKVR